MLINEILNSQDAPIISLKHEILLNLKLYIDCNDLDVLENTILVYGSISICDEGKDACVKEGTIIKNFLEKLKKFNEDSSIDKEKALKILIGCVRFLMNVSILKRGKVEIFENNGIEILFSLLDGNFKDDEQLILDILQCITNTAEEPRARIALREEKYLNRIKDFRNHQDELISEQAQICTDVITWEP